MDNPAYRDRQPKRGWTPRERMIVSGLVVVIIAVLVISGSYIAAAVLALLWVVGQVLERHLGPADRG